LGGHFSASYRDSGENSNRDKKALKERSLYNDVYNTFRDVTETETSQHKDFFRSFI
jgi:hypothetical protein